LEFRNSEGYNPICHLGNEVHRRSRSGAEMRRVAQQAGPAKPRAPRVVVHLFAGMG
jgi:hypothetical protein